MLEEKDLQAIAELIDEKIKLQTRIKALEDDMAILKPAVAYLSEQVAELKKALYQIEEKMLREQSKESAFSLDNIFMGCLNGQLHPTDAFHQMTKEKYGFTVEENAALFIVWMGNQYHKLKREAKLQMERVADHVLDFSIHSVEADAWDSLIMIIYRITDKKSKYEYFQKICCSNAVYLFEGPCYLYMERNGTYDGHSRGIEENVGGKGMESSL